jgi:serine/threonine-protein kinase
MSAAEAADAIDAADLAAVTGDPVIDGSCEPGGVIAQTPAPGTEVEVGTQVTFRVCQAPSTPEEPPESPVGATPTATPS